MFVQRDEGGAVLNTWTVRQWEGQEELPDDDAGVLAALARPLTRVPGIVTSGAFIRAAHELDWLADIDAAVAVAGQQNSLLPLLWARSSQFERRHPFVALIAQAMGKTDSEVDELFRLAGSYDA